MNITPQSLDFQESWRYYVGLKLILPHDESLWDELKQEEKSLYENGHLIREELYFEQNIEEITL